MASIPNRDDRHHDPDVIVASGSIFPSEPESPLDKPNVLSRKCQPNHMTGEEWLARFEKEYSELTGIVDFDVPGQYNIAIEAARRATKI